MIKYSKLDSSNMTKRHFKKEARQKSPIHSGNFVITFIALFIAFSGCYKHEGVYERLFTSDMPGTSLQNMTIDNNHVFYFVSSEIDKEALETWPFYSSCFPSINYLSRKAEEKSNFEIIDDRFIGGQLCFDKNNHLWSWTSSTIYKIGSHSHEKIIELPYDGGLFNSFVVDNDNNIWVGGLQTGLYKIDNRLNITHYDSELPDNSLNAIHVDKSNNIWIALCNRAVLKISKDQWVVYDNISSQIIWSLVTDKNEHLWIGTGHFNEENQSLRRFDGNQWETIYPRNEKKELVKGTVRFLQSDGRRIFAVVEHVYVFPSGGGAEMLSNELLSFDGDKWNKIYDVPDDANIFDLIVDHHRQALWVITNKEIYKIPAK